MHIFLFYIFSCLMDLNLINFSSQMLVFQITTNNYK